MVKRLGPVLAARSYQDQPCSLLSHDSPDAGHWTGPHEDKFMEVPAAEA